MRIKWSDQPRTVELWYLAVMPDLRGSDAARPRRNAHEWCIPASRVEWSKQMKRIGVVVLVGMCLALNLSCTDLDNNADLVAKTRAIKRFESEVEEWKEGADIPEEAIREYKRMQRILAESGDSEIVATPFWVRRVEHEDRIPTCRKKISITWIQTNEFVEVTGFFLVLDGRTLEFPVFDPNSGWSKDQVGENIFRWQPVYLFDEEYPQPDNYVDLVGPNFPAATLEPGLVNRLFSYDGDGDDVQIGLLLEGERKGPTCKLYGPYFIKEEPQEGDKKDESK